jgi:hypothetical protein
MRKFRLYSFVGGCQIFRAGSGGNRFLRSYEPKIHLSPGSKMRCISYIVRHRSKGPQRVLLQLSFWSTGFEVPTAVPVKGKNLWDLIPRSLVEGHWHFGSEYHLQLQGWEVSQVRNQQAASWWRQYIPIEHQWTFAEVRSVTAQKNVLPFYAALSLHSINVFFF